MGKKKKTTKSLVPFRVYCIHVFRVVFLPIMSRKVLFDKWWMWNFSSNHMPPGARAFCSSNTTRHAKNTSHASKGLVTPVSSILGFYQTKRLVTLKHVDCLTPFAIGQASFSQQKMPQSMPTSTHASNISKQTSETELPFQSQRLSFSFGVRSCCSSPGFLLIIPGLLKTWSAASPAIPDLWMRRQLQSARW